jgi:hypothetical protein
MVRPLRRNAFGRRADGGGFHRVRQLAHMSRPEDVDQATARQRDRAGIDKLVYPPVA